MDDWVIGFILFVLPIIVGGIILTGLNHFEQWLEVKRDEKKEKEENEKYQRYRKMFLE
jgi:hypothetical protein